MSATPMRMTWLPYDVFGIHRKCLHNYRKPSRDPRAIARISLKIALMKSQWLKMCRSQRKAVHIYFFLHLNVLNVLSSLKNHDFVSQTVFIYAAKLRRC